MKRRASAATSAENSISHRLSQIGDDMTLTAVESCLDKLNLTQADVGELVSLALLHGASSEEARQTTCCHALQALRFLHLDEEAVSNLAELFDPTKFPFGNIRKSCKLTIWHGQESALAGLRGCVVDAKRSVSAL